jgi:hypothetical protein
MLVSVRHANEQDLDRLEGLLGELRRLPQLRERKRGYFSRGSRAFLHFHEDAGELYVDVRLGAEFQRMRVTEPAEQQALLSAIRLEVGGRILDGVAAGVDDARAQNQAAQQDA